MAITWDDTVLEANPHFWFDFNINQFNRVSRHGSGVAGTGTVTIDSSFKKFGAASAKPAGTLTAYQWLNLGDQTGDTGDRGYLHLEFWIYTPSNPSANFEIQFNSTSTTTLSNNSFIRFDTNRRIVFFTRNGDGTSSDTLTSVAQLANGKWNHVAVQLQKTGSNSAKRIYINGVLDAQITGIQQTAIRPYLLSLYRGNGVSWIDEMFGMSWNAASTTFDMPTAEEIAYRSTYIPGIDTATASALSVTPTLSFTSNFNYNQSSIITTAFQTMPTIVILNYDNVQVTTTIPVSAEFPEPTIFVQTNSINAADPMTASAMEQDHITIIGTGLVFPPLPATALAELPEPPYAGSADKNIILEVFGTASANIVNPTVNLTPNYRQLVKRNLPSIYVNSPESGLLEPITTIINDGYDNWGTGAAISNGATAASAPGQIGAIGNGKALYPLGTNTNNWRWTFADNNADIASRYIHTPGNDFTIEFWFWTDQNQIEAFFLDYGSVIVYSKNEQVPVYQDLQIVGYTYRQGPSIRLDGDVSYVHFLDTFQSGPFQTPEDAYFANSWNHVVITGEYGNFGLTPGGNIKNLQTKIWLNGVLRSTYADRYVNNSVTDAGESAGVTGYLGNDLSQRWYFTEFATYESILPNAEILTHYDFINTSSPNRLVSAMPITAQAFLMDPTILAVDNLTFPGTPITANGTIVNPTLDVQVGDIYNAELIDVNAEFIDIAFAGNPDAIILADQLSAYAEMGTNIYRLDTAYFSYVQTNIAPYRYATFDNPTPFKDWGTDTDYGAAAPFVINGIITDATLGIDNNSLLSDDSGYTTSGLIMKESEWDDDWGSSADTYHTSFWIKKSPLDTNPNGLRVIANINGFYDNQYIILYQHAGRLKIEINDRTNPVFKAETGTGFNVFDGQRYHFVINCNHVGINDSVQVYINGILTMNLNIGNVRPIYRNGITSVPANTETNNKPRFAVGALITPYETTELPATPVTSRMYIDEVHWALTSLNQTQVTNLYTAMPFKVNLTFAADPFLALNSFVIDPMIGTGNGQTADAQTASAEMLDATATADFESVNAAGIMEASAEAIEPFSVIADNITNIEITSDLFVASAVGPNGGVIISIPGPTMYANAIIMGSFPYVDPFDLLVFQIGQQKSNSIFGSKTGPLSKWVVGDIE